MNQLRQFLIEVPHPAIFILLLVPRRRLGRLLSLPGGHLDSNSRESRYDGWTGS